MLVFNHEVCVVVTIVALSFCALMLDKTTSRACKLRMIVLGVQKTPLQPSLPKLWGRMADTCTTRRYELQRQVAKLSLCEGAVR